MDPYSSNREAHPEPNVCAQPARFLVIGLKRWVSQPACRTLNGGQSKTTASRRLLQRPALGTVNRFGQRGTFQLF
jgi:hypothetical protein